MKVFKRTLSLVLVLLVVFTSVPVTDISSFAATVDDLKLDYGTGGEITRAAWLHNLSEIFSMTVEDDEYPDNYFSDFPSNHKYYYDVLLAVEFGVVNIGVGEELKPDEAVTRDFAVTTFNYCLGFRLDEGTTYLFSDTALCSSPDDAQVAVNRGWVNLIDGKFMPALELSVSEARKMYEDANDILGFDPIQDDFENVIKFAEGVIEIPAETEVIENEDGTISVTDCPVNISVGDRFAVHAYEVPAVYRALSVSTNSNVTTFEIEKVTGEEAFSELSAQGIISSSELEVIPAEGVEIEVEEEEVPTKTRAIKKLNKNLNMKKKTFNLTKGVTASVSVRMENPYIEYYTELDHVYFTFNAYTILNYSVDADFLEVAGLSKGLTLFSAKFGPALPVASFDVTLNFSLDGSLTGVVSGDLCTGIEWTPSGGARFIKAFVKDSFNLKAQVDGSISLKASVSIINIPFISGYAYAEIGGKGSASITIFDDGDESGSCVHFFAYLYARCGVSVGIEIPGIIDKNYSKDFVIWDITNSPLKVVKHYENGREVASCTRGQTYPSYRTTSSSRYSGSGWSGGNYAYGLSATYEPIVLFDYTLDEDNKATITKYRGNAVYVTIPEEIDGYEVVAIGDRAFENSNVVYVVIPDTVNSIGYAAFAQCTKLSSVVMPDSITSIGGSAFYKSVLLKDVNLPKKLESLGAKAFSFTAIAEVCVPKSLTECSLADKESFYYSIMYDFNGTSYKMYAGPFYACDKLKNISFENGITSIPANLFSGCTGIEEITIPDSVSVIKSYSFWGCLRLHTVNLPDSVTTIDTCAFDTCVSLKNLTLPKTITILGARAFAATQIEYILIPKSLEKSLYHERYDTYYSFSYSFNGKSYILEAGPFYNCEKLKFAELEEGITVVPNHLFSGCVGLEKVVIPNTVTVIESGAFRECFRLSDIDISECVTEIESNAFTNCVSLIQIELPASLKKIGDNAFDSCDKLKNVNLPKSLTHLGSRAFAYTSLETIFIPKTLVNVSDDNGINYPMDNDYFYISVAGPFVCCDNLDKIEFEEGITAIPNFLFSGCTGLKGVAIPETVKSINKNAFSFCPYLNNIKMDNSVTFISDGVFDSCISLTEIEIPYNVTQMGEYVFDNCISLKKIELPDSITTVGQYIFRDCTSLESVKLSEKIDKIPLYAFANCKTLKTIEIPSSVETIAVDAFYNCSSLENVIFKGNSSLKNVNSQAFMNCTSLKEAILPEGVSEISSEAFRGCTSLTKVSIPSTVKNMGTSVFLQCENLSDVGIADYSIKTIDDNTFKDIPGLVEITLPKGLEKIDVQAFMNNTKLEKIYIPESVTSIATSAFSYPEKMKIHGKAGSYAETFAAENGFTFVADSIPVEGILLNGDSETIVIDRGETVKAEFELYPENANEVITLTSNNNNVTINGHHIYGRYTGESVITAITSGGLTYEFNAVVRNVNKIQIGSLPSKTAYIMGEELDLTGLVVEAVYNNGEVETVTGYTVSGFDSTVEGKCTVKITYLALSGSYYNTTFEVNVVDPTPKLTGIEITTLPAKLTYELREALDLAGMVVMASYTDGSKKAVTDYTVSGYNALRKGSQTITVTLGEFTDAFEVKVGVEATGISLVSSPSKTRYYVGDILLTEGLEILVSFSDGTTKNLTSGFTASGFDSSTKGTKTVTVTYEGFTTSFTVTVYEPAVEISQEDITLEIGETKTLTAITFPSGLSVSWSSSDEDIATVANGVVTAMGEGETDITATITYKGKKYSCVCKVNVDIEELPVVISSIEIFTTPSKTEYEIGEEFDPSGITIQINYSDGTTEIIADGFTLSGFDSESTGEKTVTVNYEGFTAEVSVNVVEVPEVVLTGISIETMPSKLQYNVGDALSTTGLKVKLLYSDGTYVIITDGFTVAGFNSNTAGEKTVTVAYESFTVIFTVTVIEIPSDASEIIVGNVTAKAGESVSVTLSTEETITIKSMAISAITFDSEKMELVGAKWNLKNTLLSNWDIGKLNGVMAFGENKEITGDICTLTFLIKEGVEDCTIAIDCTATAKKKDGVQEISVPLVTVAGSVSVANVMYGDVDGNESITSDDAIYLLYFTLLPEEYPINQECDFDKDGVVSSDDAIYLLYHTLLPDEYPL